MRNQISIFLSSINQIFLGREKVVLSNQLRHRKLWFIIKQNLFGQKAFLRRHQVLVCACCLHKLYRNLTRAGETRYQIAIFSVLTMSLNTSLRTDRRLLNLDQCIMWRFDGFRGLHTHGHYRKPSLTPKKNIEDINMLVRFLIKNKLLS